MTFLSSIEANIVADAITLTAGYIGVKIAERGLHKKIIEILLR